MRVLLKPIWSFDLRIWIYSTFKIAAYKIRMKLTTYVSVNVTFHFTYISTFFVGNLTPLDLVPSTSPQTAAATYLLHPIIVIFIFWLKWCTLAKTQEKKKECVWIYSLLSINGIAWNLCKLQSNKLSFCRLKNQVSF